MSFAKIFKADARRWVGLVLLAGAVSAIALGGAVGTGQAASSPSISLKSFTVVNNDTGFFQPTAGGNIGYDIRLKNEGTSTANHLSLTETIAPNGTVAYVNPAVSFVDPDTNDTVSPVPMTCSGTTTLKCLLTKLDVGAWIDVIVLFRTDQSAVAGTNVHDQVLLAFDSQTNGQANNKTVPLDDSSLDRQIVAAYNAPLAQTIALPGDTLPAGGTGQTSSVQLLTDPFLNNFAYVGTQLQNGTADARCLHCPAFATQISIPTAATFNSAGGGPFWDGATPRPFTWTLTLTQIPNGYKFTGVYHNIDTTPLPTCVTPTTPNTATGICVATVSITKKSIVATGLALENGTYQFG
jgi:uncharacterized repeat protein (TIGR01451 family)